MNEADQITEVASPIVAPATFYRIDPSRVTMREHLYSGWSMAPVLFLHKILRVPITVSSDDPAVDSLRPFVVPISAFEPSVATRITPLIAQLIELGFDDPVYHHVNDRLQLVTINYATMRHVTGAPAIARVHNRNWYVRHPPRSTTYVEFITRYMDGTGLWSLAERADIDRPATFRMNRHVGATSAVLWASHQQQMQRDIAAARVPAPVGDHEQMLAMIDWQHDVVVRHHQSRGVFAPLTDADRAHLSASEARRIEAGQAGAHHADVLAQLEKLQSKRGGSWLTAVIVLAVSLFLFVAASRASGPAGITPPWEYIVMVIPILFFHEAGHYVAMKIFGYRNLRMFFIPMLGAAVTGQNYTAPGWKKAIVFLMGPMPGILVAIAIGFAGLSLGLPLLMKIAVLMLILNGFNLLPFLPLDGGRLMHTLIFARWFVLDVAFRVVAALVLLLAALRFDDRILLVVAIATIVSLPAAYKLARIASNLRREGFRPGISPDDQRIPTSTAVAIIDRLKAAFKRGTGTKLIAQQTLNIYESLTARPPGVWTTLAFGIAYIASFAVAIGFAIIFTIGQADSRVFAQAWRNVNRREIVLVHALPPDRIETVRATAPDAPTGRDNWQPRNTIIATFKDSAAAQRTLETIRKDSRAASASIMLFGDSIFVSIARIDNASRAHWTKRLSSFAKQVVVDSDDYKAPLRFSCVAPSEDAAKKIEQQAIVYFQQSRQMHLVPPWRMDDSRSGEQVAQQRHAREVYLQVLTADQKAMADPAVVAMEPRIDKAMQANDRATLLTLFAKQRELLDQARTRARDNLLTKTPAASDREFIKLYPIQRSDPTGEQPGTNPATAPTTTKRLRADTDALMAAMMGQLPLMGDAPIAYDDRFSAMGLIGRNGRNLYIEYILFIDPFEGAPALVRWLGAQGCDQFRYDIRGDNSEDANAPADEKK